MGTGITKTTQSSNYDNGVNPFLLGIVRSFKSALWAVFVFSFFVNLLSLAVPLYLLQIYSKVLAGRNFDTLIFLTLIALAAVLALGLLEWIRRAVLVKLGVAFESDISEHVLNSAIHRSVLRQDPSVDVMRDLSSLRGFLSGSSVFPILDAPWTPLFILILFLLHPLLGIIGTVGALTMVALAVLNEFLTRQPVKAAARDSRSMLNAARAYVRNADTVQAMGMQASVLPQWRLKNTDTLTAGYQASRLSTRLQSITKIARLVLQISIIFAAAWLILQQQLTAGATIASVLLVRRAVAPLEQSIRSWKSVISARSAFQRVSEYLDHSSSVTTANTMPEPQGTLLLDRASYRTTGDKRSVFSRVDLSIRQGKITALVGPTAAGKSTLLRIMAGIVQPTSGMVTLGGYELSQWSPEQRGPHFGYLPQRVGLFPATVRDNIARLAEAPIEQVIQAAELANVHEMIQGLSDGYDTMIDEDGANLSAGQQQRIGLARAVFGNPSYVLLDEPDANLDATGRSLLRKALRRMREQEFALLIVSHHASLEKMADRVYRLDAGRVRLERAEKPVHRLAKGSDNAEQAQEALADEERRLHTLSVEAEHQTNELQSRSTVTFLAAAQGRSARPTPSHLEPLMPVPSKLAGVTTRRVEVSESNLSVDKNKSAAATLPVFTEGIPISDRSSDVDSYDGITSRSHRCEAKTESCDPSGNPDRSSAPSNATQITNPRIQRKLDRRARVRDRLNKP